MQPSKQRTLLACLQYLSVFPHRATYTEEARAVAQKVGPASVERHRGHEAVPLSVVVDGVGQLKGCQKQEGVYV